MTQRHLIRAPQHGCLALDGIPGMERIGVRALHDGIEKVSVADLPGMAIGDIRIIPVENPVSVMPLSGRWNDTADHYLQTISSLNMDRLIDVELDGGASFPGIRGFISREILQPAETAISRIIRRLRDKAAACIDASRDIDPVAMEMLVAGMTFTVAASVAVSTGAVFFPAATQNDGNAQRRNQGIERRNPDSGMVSKRPSLISGETIRGLFSGPLGPLHISWAFLRYWEAQSLVRVGRIDEAVRSYDNAIAAFRRAGAYGYVGQTAAIKGFAVLHFERGKDDVGETRGLSKAREAFHAFRVAAEAYGRIGNSEYASICREMMARVSRGVTTQASIMSQLWDLPIHDGRGVMDADLHRLAKKLGTFWLSPKATGKTAEYGVPLEVGELPLRLIQQGLIKILGREDLAEKMEVEPLQREVRREIQKGSRQPVIDVVQVIKWISEHMKGWETAEGHRGEVERAVEVIRKKLEDPEFLSRYVRRVGNNDPAVTNAGIDAALREHYGLYRDIRELPARETPVGDGRRSYSSTRVLGQVLRITDVGVEIDRLTTQIGAIVISPDFPDRYFEGGQLTEAGLGEAIRIATGGRFLVEDTIDEAEFDAGQGILETAKDNVVRVKVRAPIRAIRALLDGREIGGVYYPRWGNFGEETKQRILGKIGRMISRIERDGKTVIVPVAGVGVDIDLPLLQMVIERVQYQMRIEKVLMERYPDLKKRPSDSFDRIVDGVVGILSRRSFTEQLDETGTLRENLVVTAYSELIKGDARESEPVVAAVPGSADSSTGTEEPTDSDTPHK